MENAEKKLRHLVENFSGKRALWAYDYAHSEIREPIIAEDDQQGETPQWVITRNRYGALVLNVPDVVFIDVDCHPGDAFPFSGQKVKTR